MKTTPSSFSQVSREWKGTVTQTLGVYNGELMMASAWELESCRGPFNGPAKTKPAPLALMGPHTGHGNEQAEVATPSPHPGGPVGQPLLSPRSALPWTAQAGPTSSFPTASWAACSCRPWSSSWPLRFLHSSLAVWRDRDCRSGVLVQMGENKLPFHFFPPNSISFRLHLVTKSFKLPKRLSLVPKLRISFLQQKKWPMELHRMGTQGGRHVCGDNTVAA